MFVCVDCDKVVLGNKEFQEHVKYVHNYAEFSFRKIVCPHANCFIEIFTWSGFLRHIKMHKDVNPPIEIDIPVESNASSQLGLFGEDENEDVAGGIENISVETGIEFMIEQLSEFCSSLLATGLTNSSIDVPATTS